MQQLMKKIFTLIVVSFVMAISAFATDYTDTLRVTVAGTESTPQKTTINVTTNSDGTYNFLLKDFSFEGMKIGDIKMDNVKAKKENGVTYLEDNQKINVGFIPFSFNVKLQAELYDNETKMYATMSMNVLRKDINVVFGKKQVVTGIGAVNANTVNAGVEIYDLSGKRVSNMQQGKVYIVRKNGKAHKVIGTGR